MHVPEAGVALLRPRVARELGGRERAWVEREQLASFSKRDAWRALRGRFGKAADLDAPLAMLVEHGHLREAEREPSGRRGRKPSPIYLVNPLGQNGHDGHNTARPEEHRGGELWPEHEGKGPHNGHK